MIALLCRTALMLAGLGLVAGAPLAYYKLHSHALTPAGMAIAYLAPVLAGILFIRMAKLLPAPRLERLAVECLAIVASIFVIEAGLTAFGSYVPNRQVERAHAAAKLGMTFDLRTKSEMVDALRARGVDAYPGISRNWLLSPAMKERLGAAVYPLSQVADGVIVECNETGQYLTFTSDEYGFNNPPGLMASGRADIVALGSSYTLGHCVPGLAGFVNRVRERYPRTVNLALAGTYVLADLATLREYAEPLRPRVVLWTMYPNSIEVEEAADPILSHYVEPQFSQHLMERRAEVDALLRKSIEPVQVDLDRKLGDQVSDFERQRWRRVVVLPHLRDQVNNMLLPTLKGIVYQPPSPEDLSAGLAIIRAARDEVHGWGGELVVVLLPMYDEVVAKQIPPARGNERMVPLLQSQGLHVINGVELFRRQRDPSALFNLRISNHFTEAGHRLLGDYIVADLERTYPDLQTRSE